MRVAITFFEAAIAQHYSALVGAVMALFTGCFYSLLFGVELWAVCQRAVRLE